MNGGGKRLIIIDSNAIIHRAFHALPPLTTKKGELVNAVYGFLLALFKTIRELKPDFIVACFDFPGPTFRHQQYKLYKATRPKAPEELYQQIPKVKKILENFNIQIFEKEGYEADDIIGAIANLASKKQKTPKIETIILTGDTDTLQLVDKNIKVYAIRKRVKDTILYDKERVKERYQGLNPKELVDFKALRGDPTDNIPGIFGIGEKTATYLLKKFRSLENLYREIERNSKKAQKLKPVLKEKILKYKDQAFISKNLAKLNFSVPLDFNLDKCRWGQYNKEKIIKIFNNYEFKSLINRLPEPKNREDTKAKELVQIVEDGGAKENLSLW